MKFNNMISLTASILLTISGSHALSADLTAVKPQGQSALKRMEQRPLMMGSQKEASQSLQSLQKEDSKSASGFSSSSQQSLSELQKSEKDSSRQNEQQSLDGNSNGGGGLGYKLPDGTAMTLPEFGVLFEDKVPTITTGKVYPRYYEISAEVWAEYKLIERKIQAFVPSFVIPGTFAPKAKQLVSKMDVNTETYEQIKREYRQVLEAFGHELEDEKMILPAYTQNGVTYILPDFDRLNKTQKAKYLIHESNMRETLYAGMPFGRLKTLERALKIDTLVQQLAFPKNGQPLDTFNVLQRMSKLGMLNEVQIFQHMMLMLVGELAQRKQELRAADFSEDAVLRQDIELDPSWIQELQIRHNLKYNYAEMFEGTVINYGGGHHFKSLAKRHCKEDENTPARIIADPINELYQDMKGLEFFAKAPVTGVKLAVCDGSFGSMSVLLTEVYLKKAGPFIQKLQGK